MKDIDDKIRQLPIEKVRKLFTKENPHPTGAYWDVADNKWRGYRPTKGVNPPWLPYSPKHREKKVTINEKKFLMVLSQTGNMNEAFRTAYKYTAYPDKRIESARIGSAALRVLKRIKEKAPELVAAFTFDDINPDFIKRELLNLYNHDHATIGERTRLLELMGKTHAMFTDKIVSDTKIREVVDSVYTETSDDMPEQKDDRKNRHQVEEINLA